MQNCINKTEMLEAFKAYLDSLDDDESSEVLGNAEGFNHAEGSKHAEGSYNMIESIQAGDEQDLHSDLYSLFVEMSALKNEVKIQARQFKSAIEDFREVFVALRQTQDHLTKELEIKTKQNRSINDSVTQHFLLELIALRDRIILSIDTMKNYSPKGIEKWFAPDNTWQKNILEGQTMILRRIDRQLKSYQVRLVKTRDQRLNPHLMKVVALDNQADKENGLVLEEVRAGFTWNKKVLRPAEVKVNKLEISEQ